MYTIGEFSKINFVTTKALRHYDEIGLLKPAETDRFTGYRSYSSAQLPRINQILILKQLGCSLAEIAAMLDSSDANDTRRVLEAKQREVSQNIKEEQHRLRLIENFLNDKKGEFMNHQYTALIKALPGATVASMRTIIASYDELFHLMPKVLGPEMERLGCICAKPDYCFNVYHYDEYKETDIDVELCQAVTEPKQNSQLVTFKVLPLVETAVTLLHKGPYSTLRDAYLFAMQYIENNGYKLCGHPRESYIDGIWNKENEEEWLTELQFPVTKL